MTTGSDIAFWEILHDKVLRSVNGLHCLPARLVFSGDGLQHPTLVLLCCLFLVLVPIYFLASSRPLSLKEDQIHTRAALQALVTVVVPTCSLWPSRYIELASVLRSHISIPLEVIIKDTIDGVVEFRNPSTDLANLIGSGATANGHTIRINIGWKWWIKYFQWWMLPKEAPTGQFKSGHIGLSDWPYRDIPTANPTPLDLSSSPFASPSSTSCPLLCLDCLPHCTLPFLSAGSKVTLEFTTFSSSLWMLSTAQILSAIPFTISERSRRRPRSLVSVLKQLSASYDPNMVIDSLSNVSVDYEQELRHLYESFSVEQKIRETWVKSVGIKAWRREMFLVALEAALVRLGWVERWAVQVTVI